MARSDDLCFLARALSPCQPDERAARRLRDELGGHGSGWQGVVELASQQLVTPTLYQALREKDLLTALPAEVRDYLDAVHTLNGERNRHIADQTVEITAVLNRAGIEPVLLKGVAHLFEGLYGDPAARIIGDVDLLLSSEVIERAAAALAAIGYRPLDLGDVSFAGHHHAAPLVREGEVACVELHTEPVAEAFASLLTADGIQREARPVAVGGAAAWRPAWRDLLVHSIVHAQLADRDYWCGRIALRALCDLVRLRLAGDEAVDWGEILAAFDRAGYGNACRAHLMLAQRLLGQSPPPALAPSVGARFACWRAAAQIRHPWLMALGESYGHHRAMLVRLGAGPSSRRRVLARLLHPRGYQRYLRSLKRQIGRFG